MGTIKTNQKVETSWHHIISSSELNTLVPSKNVPIEQRLKIIGDYMNVKHIKKVVLEHNLTSII
jgi:hypothetical protein